LRRGPRRRWRSSRNIGTRATCVARRERAAGCQCRHQLRPRPRPRLHLGGRRSVVRAGSRRWALCQRRSAETPLRAQGPGPWVRWLAPRPLQRRRRGTRAPRTGAAKRHRWRGHPLGHGLSDRRSLSLSGEAPCISSTDSTQFTGQIFQKPWPGGIFLEGFPPRLSRAAIHFMGGVLSLPGASLPRRGSARDLRIDRRANARKSWDLRLRIPACAEASAGRSDFGLRISGCGVWLLAHRPGLGAALRPRPSTLAPRPPAGQNSS